MKFSKQITVIMLCALTLAGCVTEVSNPVFNVERSEEEALADYIRLASGYLEQGELASAKRHLDNAAELDRNNSEVHAIWALIYAREGEPELADDNFRRALRIDGNNTRARNNYAAFLFANNRFEDAFDQLQLVVRDTGYNARSQAFENLGLAALRLDRLEEAEQAFNRALQLNPNQLRSSLELCALSLRKDDIPQARAYYQNFLTLSQFFRVGQNARSLWIGAQVALAQGNRENAREYGQQLEQRFRESAEFRQYQQAMP